MEHLAHARLTLALCPLEHLLLLHNRGGRHWLCWAALLLHPLGACDPPAANWLCMCSNDAVFCCSDVHCEELQQVPLARAWPCAEGLDPAEVQCPKLLTPKAAVSSQMPDYWGSRPRSGRELVSASTS